MYYNHNRGTDFVLGAVVGGSIAALTTLLFTTKQGKRIQSKIKDKFEELEDDAKEGLSNAKEHVEEAGEHVRKKVAHAAK